MCAGNAACHAAGMGQGSVTTYGNSKSIADKARRLFHSAARSQAGMDEFKHHNKTSLLAVRCVFITGCDTPARIYKYVEGDGRLSL